MSDPTQKLSFAEKVGYSCGDAAANFVFMSMVLFQANFYTDVFGLAAATAGTIILVARLWDAFFDPIMGITADRTHTRWGRFRPWVPDADGLDRHLADHLRRRHEHPADDRLLDEQHAVLGARGRHDGGRA